LGTLLRRGRETAGLSVRQLEAQSGVAKSTIFRLEQDDRPAKISAVVLANLAQALEIPSTELFRAAQMPVPSEMPSLPAMLRAEYDVPPEAVQEMQRSLARIARRYQSTKNVKKPSNERRDT
jgi:transcriptional regulator with XRE-family HTH domain